MMKMTAMVLALSACSGCVDERRWDLGTTITPTPGHEWEVAEAAAKWSDAVMPLCGRPVFELGDDGRPVLLLTEEEWSASGRGPGLWGTFDGDEIAVKLSNDPQRDLLTQNTLLHEMGHALGIGHVSALEQPYSVMIVVANTRNVTPTVEDAQQVAEEHGCR